MANKEQRPSKEQRKKEAEKHLTLMKSAFSEEIDATVAATTVYEDGEGRELPLPEPAFESTEVTVTTAFIPEALATTTGKAAVVDPASFTRPGGAYEDGVFGPEQVICSESNLYPILCKLRNVYYGKNRGYQCGQLFTDRALYLPDVVFTLDGAIRTADVIAIPEPNRKRALENNRSERECDVCLAGRIDALLHIAVANGCEVLVCGAFGCGRDGFSAKRVAEIFAEWIEAHPGALRQIVFAVPRAHENAFNAAFGTSQPAKASDTAEEAASTADDDFDIHDIDLPEGVTLR